MSNSRIVHVVMGMATLAAVFGGIEVSARDAREGPDLGTPLSEADVSPIDLTVAPDGSGLPDGAGTVARGRVVYAGQCAACHGDAGKGGVSGFPALTGGVGSLASDKPVKTVNSFWPSAPLVFDYIRRAMPIAAPQSLSSDEYYAVTAYLLSVDNIVPADAQIDAGSLAKVKMPNHDGFRPLWSRAGKPTDGAIRPSLPAGKQPRVPPE